MRSDESGVGGFFEDLPVLMFVLAGTSVLVASASLAAEAAIVHDRGEDLERLASNLADSLVSELHHGQSDLAPSISSLCATALQQNAREITANSHYRFAVLVVHPELRFVCTGSSSDDYPNSRAAAESRLLNAIADDGLTAILAVRVVVW